LINSIKAPTCHVHSPLDLFTNAFRLAADNVSLLVTYRASGKESVSHGFVFCRALNAKYHIHTTIKNQTPKIIHQLNFLKKLFIFSI